MKLFKNINDTPRFRILLLVVLICVWPTFLVPGYENATREITTPEGDSLQTVSDFAKRPVRSGLVSSEFLIYIYYNVRRPLMREFCLAVAKIDFSGRDNKYISKKEIREIKKVLKPGDILFRRNDQQLTNIAIPGFWTHSGIYIGGGEEINDFFGNIEMLHGKKPSEYIANNYPQISRRITFRRSMIIEAVGEGVSIDLLDKFASADYFAAIRPSIDKETLFKILMRSFDFYNVPYDFFFDFQSDDALICSELVYKSFCADSAFTRLAFRSQNLTSLLYPNEIASEACDTTRNNPFSLVTIFSGDIHTGKATEESAPSFKKYTLE